MLWKLGTIVVVAVLLAGLVQPVASASDTRGPSDAVAVTDVEGTPSNATDTDVSTEAATTADDGIDESTTVTDRDSEPTVDDSTEETATGTTTTVDDTDESVTETEASPDETTSETRGSVTGAQEAIDETVTETQETADETITDAEGTADDTVTETRETVEDTVTETDESVDDTVTETQGTVNESVQTVDEAERTADRTEEIADRTVDVTGTVDEIGEAEEDVTGAIDETTRTVNETTESANEALTGGTGEVEDRTTTEALPRTTEKASYEQAFPNVTSTAPSDGATTGDPTSDGPSTAATTAGVTGTSADGVENGSGSDERGPSPEEGVVGVGAVLAIALVHRGATSASVFPDVVHRGLVSLGRVVDVDSVRVRFWRILTAFGYSRFDDSDPLEHDRRAALYERVEDSPGLSLTSLAEETDVPLSSARYHLRVLEREGLVVDRKIRGKRRFVPPGADNDERVAALRDEATARVLDALARNGPSSVSALADDLERDPSTVCHHLDGLEEAALVERHREGRAVVNSLTPTARSMLDARGGSPPRNDHFGQTD